MAAGAQVFLLGTGVVRPLCLNAAWLCALCALPACMLTAAACHRALSGAQGEKCARARIMHGMLALSFSLAAAFSAAALAALAEQSLLAHTRAAHSMLIASTAIALCAFAGGEGAARLAFALRFALPVLLFLLCASSLPLRGGVGLFPLLGTGAIRTAGGAGIMLGSAFPVLMLLYPPQESEAAEIPRAGFFVRRVLAGAACGAALVLAVTLGGTYESMAAQHAWGERLLIAVGGQRTSGLAQMGLVLVQIPAIALPGANMLLAGARAARRAFPGLSESGASCLACAPMFGASAALLAVGFDAAPAGVAALGIPLAAALLAHRRLGGGFHGGEA